ncbi:hypothetical protein NBT05_08000 [Aquimarina sp. ERC-38]|uniref:hypothetical protein n=1 Tax=Aquimarina sp. ERC-38 TaxID=2949996 RepID=UPI002247BCB4|nr:hypothetical protein [Aquimarina sp. ERC-38]UZO82404.1 hypothetical protein NBT05_08000 [Aquimarina sp. ERC-38]
MIGYYAHYHGYGHSNYANELMKELQEDMTIFSPSSFDFTYKEQVVPIEDEELTGTEYDMEYYETPEYLHCAPMNLSKITSRSATILNTILEKKIKLLLVDVNVEIATLARVASVPFAYRRMFGKRNDAPHLNAYREACFLMAYYPESLESEDTPDWVRRKTYYTGFISKAKTTGNYLDPVGVPFILVIQGKGGSKMDASFYKKLADRFTNTKIIVLGSVPEHQQHKNITYPGFVSNIIPYIDHADYIISSCGSNTTSELLSRKRKFLMVPEERPFEEQNEICKLMEKNKLGVRFDSNNITKSMSQLDALPDYIPEEYLPGSFVEFARFLKSNQYDADLINKALTQKNLSEILISL